ncbi:hypothetical protein [Lactococcus taiwanensis]|nr:hypothetical protein [Lactococcus taiwanensis]
MSQNNHFHYLLKRLGSSITDTEELTALSVTYRIFFLMHNLASLSGLD